MIEAGNWGEDIQWEVHKAVELPPADLCTAVFCLGFTPDNNVVLMRAARGWSLVGGHIEEGETILDALVRESLEEGGFHPQNPQLFAHRKITSAQPVLHQNQKAYYPHPVSYNLFYWTMIDRPLAMPTGHEVLEHGAFSLTEATTLHATAASIITLGYEAYQTVYGR